MFPFSDSLDADEPEWMLEYARNQKRQAFVQRTQELEIRLERIRAKEQQQRERFQRGEPQQKRTVRESRFPKKAEAKVH